MQHNTGISTALFEGCQLRIECFLNRPACSRECLAIRSDSLVPAPKEKSFEDRLHALVNEDGALCWIHLRAGVVKIVYVILHKVMSKKWRLNDVVMSYAKSFRIMINLVLLIEVACIIFSLFKVRLSLSHPYCLKANIDSVQILFSLLITSHKEVGEENAADKMPFCSFHPSHRHHVRASCADD